MDDRRDPPHDPGADAAASTGGQAAPPEPDGQATPAADGDGDEVDVFRRELARTQEALALARAELEVAEDRALRARADLDNLRRRSVAEQERARAQGLDAAILPVLSVHDDLVRALEAAERSDPSSIVPGVASVLQGLVRQLEALGIQRTGAVGEPFDASVHEAILAVPATSSDEPGTIQAVFEAGFVAGERLVRPARVVVYREESQP